MEQQSRAEGKTPVSSKGRVLIVDDEPDVLQSTALLVESLGYEAISVQDPLEILETIERELPGIVLQDLKMPDLNVAGLVAALRLNPTTADIPLVFFSAGGDLATTAARYDVWGFLAKPFGRRELSQLLHQVLGPPDDAGVIATRDVQRDMNAMFHDYWNLLAALSNYILILDESEGRGSDADKAVQGLGELILKLESKTDRMRAQIMGFLGSLEQTPPSAGQARGQSERPRGTVT